jgi:hypothetical protein
MTTVDLTLEELCIAVYYMAAFEITWAEGKGRLHTERARIRWLKRHAIYRGRVAKYGR